MPTILIFKQKRARGGTGPDELVASLEVRRRGRLDPLLAVPAVVVDDGPALGGWSNAESPAFHDDCGRPLSEASIEERGKALAGAELPFRGLAESHGI